MCEGFQFVEDERVGLCHANGTHLRSVDMGISSGHDIIVIGGTRLDCTLGGAISHDLLSAPLLVLHLDHTTELLVRRTKHSDFDSVGQASIFDRRCGCVSGFLALVEEFLPSRWDCCERF